MEHENLFRKLENLQKEMERILNENPTGPDEPDDPRIRPIIMEAQRIFNELDPLVRGVFGGRRATLAWWEDIIHKINSVKLPEAPDPEAPDPRVEELIEQGMRATRELDPIVRETYRDNPEKLAEWDEIMHMDPDYVGPDYDKKDTDKSGS